MAGTENATRRIDDQITMSADLDATGSTGALIALGRGATTGLRAEIELGDPHERRGTSPRQVHHRRQQREPAQPA